jgi:glycosyltransferase-like protein
MLSVGILTYSTKPRGSVVHAVSLAEALTARGLDVTLYALTKAGDDFYRKVRCKTHLFPAAEAPVEPDALIRQRIGELQRGLLGLATRHAIWHAEDCLSASALLKSELSRLRPVVRTVHHVERFESRYLADCQRHSVECADLVLSVSEFTAREVRAEFGRDAVVIHNGVDHERFGVHAMRDAESRHAELAAEFGIGSGDEVILSVGGVEERKNSLRSLAAMRLVLERHPGARWLIAGGASIWEHAAYRARFELERAALPAPLRARILWLGPVAEDTLTALYRRSDVLLCASLHEGWGLSVAEAMAAGTAVVCSEGEPFSEFTDASTAAHVDPLSVASIASGVSRLLSYPAVRRRQALAARARARTFSWDRAARLHERAYQRLLRDRAGARLTDPSSPVAALLR